MVKVKKVKSGTRKESKIEKLSKSKTKLRGLENTRKKKNVLEKDLRKVIDSNSSPQESLHASAEIKPENIEKALVAVLKFHSENPKLKNNLFDDQFPIFLQISCFKVPRGFSKIYRIPLKYSLYNDESEICLIVSEIKGIKNSEHDQHREHYEKLLVDKGVENIKQIMTFHEFRTEYETFEQKGRLVDLYDVFLADSKISGKVVKKCGKIFYKKRKVPASVKLQVTKLKEHFDKTLSKTFLHLHLKGNSFSVQIGHSKMKITELQENVSSILQFLEKDFPGGFSNLMGIQVFAPRSSTIPLYFSTKSGKDVAVPKVVSKKPKAFKTYRGELTTLPNAEVIVKPSGQVIVVKTTDKEGETPGKDLSKEKLDRKSKRKFEQNAEDVSPIKKTKAIEVEPNKKISKEVISSTSKRPKTENVGRPSRICLSKSTKKALQTIDDLEHQQQFKPVKKKKSIIVIESGKIIEEEITDILNLGDQKQKKNKVVISSQLKENKKKSKSINGFMKKQKTVVKNVKNKKVKKPTKE